MTPSPHRIAQAKRDLGLAEDQDIQAINHLRQLDRLRRPGFALDIRRSS